MKRITLALLLVSLTIFLSSCAGFPNIQLSLSATNPYSSSLNHQDTVAAPIPTPTPAPTPTFN